MTTTPEGHLALELERIRSGQQVGFEQVKGRLDLLVQRSEQTEKALDNHDSRLTTLERGFAPLVDADDRITSVERRVWMASGAATLVATAAGWVIGFLGH